MRSFVATSDLNSRDRSLLEEGPETIIFPTTVNTVYSADEHVQS